jgi:hypothetical protein
MTQALPSTPAANEVRLANADRRVRVLGCIHTVDGMAQLAAELEAQPRWPKRLTVAETLRWPHRSMPWHRQALLRHAGLSETRTVASLTAREVGVLCHALRSPATWRGRG